MSSPMCATDKVYIYSFTIRDRRLEEAAYPV